jgi:hypothetical protein
MPLLLSEHFQRLFPNVCPFWLLGATSSLFCPLRLYSLRRVTPAQRVIFMLSPATSFRGPQFLCVQTFLKTIVLRHAIAARRDTFLQVTANFFRDPQSPRSVPSALRVAPQLDVDPYAASSVP